MNRRDAYLIRIVIRWRDLDCGGQVEDDPLIARPCLAPSSLDRLADFDGKVRLGLCESLRAVFILELGSVLRGALLGQLAHDFGMTDSEVDGLLLRVAEDDVAEEGGSCVVHVEDRLLAARHSVDRPLDQILTGWCQDLVPLHLQRGVDRKALLRTCIHTSSGTSPFSISPRTKLKSVSLAAG